MCELVIFIDKLKRSIKYIPGLWLLTWLIMGFGNIRTVQAIGNQNSLPKPLNVVLITIDTLRADHLGCYGYQEIKTPNIDFLARQGIMFTRHYTPVPITLPSHATIMTGLYPPAHGIRNNGTCVLGDSALTLAEIFKKQKYRTAAFVGAYVLHSRFGLAQGFETYDDSFPQSQNFILSLFNEKPAAGVMESAFIWLEKHKDEKFFLWVHLFDPHAPYSPPPPFRKTYNLQPYDGEIAYVDSQIGRLLEKIDRLNLKKNTLLVLTADHGEGLDDHGEKTHAVFIYDSTLRIPLIFYCPDFIPAAQKISEDVCTVDIVPTILDILTIPLPSHLQGCSLTDLMWGRKKTLHRSLYCESHYPELNFGWSRLEGIRTKQWKYIKAPQSELYNVIQDPHELHNLISQKPAVSESLRNDLQIMKNTLPLAMGAPPAQMIQLDAQTKKRLESLGYVWTKPESSLKQKQIHLPDPKDMINILLNMDVALFYSVLGLYEKAIEYLQKVVSANPANMRAHFYLAANYEEVGKYDESIAEYQKVIQLDPDFSEAYNSLGTVYDKKGLTDQALMQFQIAEKLNGNYVEVHYNLGVVYEKKKQYDKALFQLKKAARLDPNHPSVCNNLGSVYIKVGRTEEAIREFQKAIQNDPNHEEAYNNLGIAYKLSGEHEKAQKFFQLAIQLNPGNTGAHSNLAGFYIMKKQYDLAIASAQKALLCDDQWVEAYINLGIAYFYLGQYQKAITYLEKAVILDEQQIEAHANLGLCYFFLEDYEKAKKYYQKSLRLEPGNLKALINLGTIYYKENNISQAITKWKKSLEYDPNSTEAHMNLGSAYMQQGEHNQAIQYWKKVLKSDPNQAAAHLNLGNCYYQMGLVNLAISAWSKNVLLDSTPVAAHRNLATAYYLQGKKDLAIREWQTVSSLDPGNADAYYHLGMINYSGGNYDQAISDLSQALSLKPDYPEARTLLNQARWLADSVGL